MNAKKLLDYLLLAAAWALAVALLFAPWRDPRIAVAAFFFTLTVGGFVAGTLKLSWVPKHAPAPKQLRVFSAAICVLLTAISWLFVGRESAFFWPVQGAGLIFLAAGMILPVSIKGVETLWTPLAGGLLDGVVKLGFVISYYTVFFGTAVIMRIVGRDPLDRKIDKSAASYWIKREPSPKDSAARLERYRRQF